MRIGSTERARQDAHSPADGSCTTLTVTLARLSGYEHEEAPKQHSPRLRASKARCDAQAVDSRLRMECAMTP
jgi:hypothetical protein